MKIALTYIGLVSTNRIIRESSQTLNDQALELVRHYNPDFDETKYFNYGCNCEIFDFELDESPQAFSFGPPVDALDRVCKAYKDCLTCARNIHGPRCRGESSELGFEVR